LICCVFALMSFGSSPRAQVLAGSGTIVLLTSAVPKADIHGDWLRITDPSAAGGAALQNPNRSRAKIAPALAAPTNYFDMRFNLPSGAYHLWLRMRAQSDATGNDSVHVQFSDAFDSAGRTMSRIGSSQSAEVVLQNGSGGSTPQGWGWADNGWGAAGAPIYFHTSGGHVLRIQQREDGAIVDQVVLSRDSFASTPPGVRLNDRTILHATSPDTVAAPPPPPPSAGTIVIWASKVSNDDVFGAWRRIADATAAGGAALQNRDAGLSKIAPALARPASYFETTFTAAAHKAYHVWVHMRAEGNSAGNDSVHLQFNDSVTSSGAAFARIGTASSAEFVLQGGSRGAAPHGWGWTENGWDTYGPHIFFASSSTHTVRVQQREDGAIIDQIVISPDAYLTTAPGARRDDRKIFPATAAPFSAPAAEPPPPPPPPSSSEDTKPSGGTAGAAALPNGQLDRDIGGVRVAGHAAYASGRYTVSGAGADIWGGSDQFHFVYRTLVGDATLVARVASIQAVNAWTKAGLMIRESLAAGSRHASVFATPAKGYAFQWRSATSGATLNTAGGAGAPPAWVRLVRRGSTFEASRSSDGVRWTTIGTRQIAMAQTVYVGLAVSSHDAARSATAVFDGVSVSGGSAANPSTGTGTGTSGTGTAPSSWTVVFTPPPDHATKVASYLLEVFAAGANPATAAPKATTSLGKPALNASGDVSIDRTAFFTGLPAGSYIATVSAMATGRKDRSEAYSFTR
jgi:regulation of enolase protein 1 (concanavalin A-like superfamily)